MSNNSYYVDPDITVAETLPSSFYRDTEVFEKLKSIFLNSYHFIGDINLVPLPGFVYPFTLLDSYLTEPLVLVRNDNDEINCFSNVCSHRGNIVVNNPGKNRVLQCMYHGRMFDLNGKFKRMPEFNEVQNFPRPCDNLHQFKVESLGPFLFCGLNTDISFKSVINEINSKVSFLPLDEFVFSSSLSKDYLVNCHWALYCDNYLEGFHIPFVHPELNQVLDYGKYEVLIKDKMTIQVGYANDGEESFQLPADHSDFGKQIAAYYFWIFPNIMFNFYPWGLSINVVKPISVNKTKVSFLTYIYNEEKFEGNAALIDKVEREDEFVVEGVTRGMQSSFYNKGRFSATREKGVHYFHQLLSDFIN